MANVGQKEFVAPCAFPFPFEPYSIQVDFMKSLYQVIEKKKIGVFESPTGTGKSLSLICGTLTWLRDHNERVKQEIEATLSFENTVVSDNAVSPGGCDPFWVEEFAQKQLIDAEVQNAKRMKKLIEKRENQLRKARTSSALISQIKREKYLKRKRESDRDETILLMEQAKRELEGQCSESRDEIENSEDAEFALDDYESEDESTNNENEERDATTRVFFCSRTHSQLSQFIHELQKSPFGNHGNQEDVLPVSVATLASRNSLCINDSVRKLGSVHQMNEKCLEMQKNVKKKSEERTACDEPKRRRRDRAPKKTCRCYSNSEGISRLTNNIVGNILDVEEIVKKGKEIEACPYYSARHALPYCQLVVVPYQILLHEGTRLASGINIKDSVIIIDEAHNLVEAINAMYSCQISARQLAKALSQLSQYSHKFNKRLKAKNLFYVKQLIYVIRQLLSVATASDKKQSSAKGQFATKSSNESKLFKLVEFLFNSSLDNINFYKLLRYCARSKISMKLSGFVEKYEVALKSSKPRSVLAGFLEEIKNPAQVDDVTQRNNDAVMRSPLMHIESFLSSLTSSHADGRVAVATGSDPSLKFLLLNPAVHFKKILDQCRSVIVAGGTMQPSSCMIDQLIPQAEQARYASRIVEFSCGHVIDGSKQLLPIALSSGPSNECFQFTFEKRNNFKIISELGRLLINLFNIVPGGVVCFFPSYEYENVVFERWKDDGTIAKLEARKKVFREPKKTSDCDQVLAEYSSCIERTRKPVGKMNGSCLLSVVGGKMSEGINFSDDLGRCVVMVGLPYPNIHSLELKEKMDYLTKNMPRHIDGRTAGQVHYESLCMKAVNQSIGRAIRHKNDFACLLLIDQRFGKPSVSNKLPDWIGRHLKKFDQFGAAFSSIRKFFNDKYAKEGNPQLNL